MVGAQSGHAGTGFWFDVRWDPPLVRTRIQGWPGSRTRCGAEANHGLICGRDGLVARLEAESCIPRAYFGDRDRSFRLIVTGDFG